MSETQAPPSPTPPRRNAFPILRAFLRLVLVLMIGGFVGLLGYAGLTLAYQQALEPMHQNRAALAQVQGQLSIDEEAAAQMAQRLLTAESAAMQANRTILTLQENQKSQQKVIGAQATALSQMKPALSTLEAGDKESQRRLAAVQKTLAAQEKPLTTLKNDLAVVQVMELLTRSRVYLTQSNFGLAREDILTARQILLGLGDTAPAYQQAAVKSWLQRIDLALGNLPEYPVLAADDLEIAWQLMRMGLPPEHTTTPTPTETPQDTPTPSPTASPSVTILPSASATAIPTTSVTPAWATPIPSRTPTP